jgi:hypothetical protein
VTTDFAGYAIYSRNDMYEQAPGLRPQFAQDQAVQGSCCWQQVSKQASSWTSSRSIFYPPVGKIVCPGLDVRVVSIHNIWVQRVVLWWSRTQWFGSERR